MASKKTNKGSKKATTVVNKNTAKEEITVEEMTKDFSEMTDLEKLKRMDKDFRTVALLEQKKQEEYTKLNACYDEYKALDKQVYAAYGKHAKIKGNYTTDRAEKIKKTIADENAGVNDKRTKPLATITTLVMIALALIASIISFEDLYETEYGVMAVIVRIAFIIFFSSAIFDIRKNGKSYGIGTLVFRCVLYGGGAIFLIGLYVRIEEMFMVPVLDVAWILFFLIANAVARSMHPNIKKLEAKIPELEALDKADLAKIEQEVDAQMDSLRRNTYPEVEALKAQYAPIEAKIAQIKDAVYSFDAKIKKANAIIQENNVVAESDKKPYTISKLIEWLEGGRAKTLKEALRIFDYDQEAADLAMKDLNHVVALAQKNYELEDSISSIEAQIASSRLRTTANQEKRRSEIDKLVSDAEEKYGSL